MSLLRVLLVLALCQSQLTNATEAYLSWTEPTQNEDGSPLTDLTSYEIWHGCGSAGVYTDVEVIPSPATTYTVSGLPDIGVCYFAAKATNSGGVSSAYSNEASKTFGSLPGPVQNTAITWIKSSHLYSLPETDFGPHVVAGNWSVPGQSLDIIFEVTPRTYPTTDGRIISKANDNSEQGHFFMVSMNSGTFRFRLKTGGVTSTLFGSEQISLGVKTSGRVTYDGIDMKIFVNGILDAQMSKSGDMDSSPAEVWVGSNPPDNYGLFDGLISVTIN